MKGGGSRISILAAVCSASRAGLLTGCYPNRIGINGALGPNSKIGISDGEMTLAQLVKQKGYATAIYGKWHLGDRRSFSPRAMVSMSTSASRIRTTCGRIIPRRSRAPIRRYPSTRTKRHPRRLTHADQEQLTIWYAEHAVSFIERHKDQPSSSMSCRICPTSRST